MKALSKKQVIMQKTDGRCGYCGIQLTLELNHPNSAVLDHIHPKSLGGSKAHQNLIACCFTCNSKKGNRPLKDLRINLACGWHGIPMFNRIQVEWLHDQFGWEQPEATFFCETLGLKISDTGWVE